MSGRQVIVGVTGASGALYAGRLLRALLVLGHTVHLVLSRYGRFLLHEELEFRPDQESVLQFLVRLYGREVLRGELREYGFNDLASTLASGSVPVDGMAVVPCSVKTLSGIARGAASNLVERAADVALKERRPLVLVPPRDTAQPDPVAQSRNGGRGRGIIVPAMPAFYQKPRNFDDLGDFIAGRVCNLLRIEHDLFRVGQDRRGRRESFRFSMVRADFSGTCFHGADGINFP